MKVNVLFTLIIFSVAQDVLSETPILPEPQVGKPVSLDHPLDLAFIMDTTGSMGSYIASAKENIRAIVDEIIQTSNSSIRLALIEYRDHPPQDKTYVIQAHDFTDSVDEMKNWLEKSRASGGGDTPEAVADALYGATKLSWHVESTKLAVLISDAPPHGIDPASDVTFKNGCPANHDPMETVRKLAKMGITLYSVGVEPSINNYKEFFAALAYLTGGQYIPMRDPRHLINVIIGGAEEQLSLTEFTSEVEREIERQMAEGGEYDEDEVARTVYEQLAQRGVKSRHLVRNQKELKGPNKFALKLAHSHTMSEVKGKMQKKLTRRKSRHDLMRPKYAMETDMMAVGPMGSGKLRIPEMMHSYALVSKPAYVTHRKTSRRRFKKGRKDRKLKSKRNKKKSKGDYSVKESEISMDQINRLVKKLSSKHKS